jgi:hypothetical protein
MVSARHITSYLSISGGDLSIGEEAEVDHRAVRRWFL